MASASEFAPINSSRFGIEIEGVNLAAFTALDGLEVTTDVVIYREGGSSTTHKAPGRTHYSNLILRHGYVENEELWHWYRNVIDGQLERKNGSITALRGDGSPIVRFEFYRGWPCRWKGFVFDANRSGTLFEEIEIAVERLERTSM